MQALVDLKFKVTTKRSFKNFKEDAEGRLKVAEGRLKVELVI